MKESEAPSGLLFVTEDLCQIKCIMKPQCGHDTCIQHDYCCSEEEYLSGFYGIFFSSCQQDKNDTEYQCRRLEVITGYPICAETQKNRPILFDVHGKEDGYGEEHHPDKDEDLFMIPSECVSGGHDEQFTHKTCQEKQMGYLIFYVVVFKKIDHCVILSDFEVLVNCLQRYVETNYNI